MTKKSLKHSLSPTTPEITKVPPGLHIKLDDFCRQLRDINTSIQQLTAEIAFFAGSLFQLEEHEDE